MLRPAGLLAALLLLPACHGEDELQVTNLGGSAVLVDVAVDEHDPWCECGRDHDHHLFEVPPGATVVVEVGHVDEMDVLITRQSDGLILFYDEYDADDFDDDDGKIEIAVSP